MEEAAVLPAAVVVGQEVPRTSLAEYRPSPDEMTVQFLRWTPVNGTAYMRGQQAGFAGQVANRLVANGVAMFVLPVVRPEDRMMVREPIPRRMVQK